MWVGGGGGGGGGGVGATEFSIVRIPDLDTINYKKNKENERKDTFALYGRLGYRRSSNNYGPFIYRSSFDLFLSVSNG